MERRDERHMHRPVLRAGDNDRGVRGWHEVLRKSGGHLAHGSQGDRGCHRLRPKADSGLFSIVGAGLDTSVFPEIERYDQGMLGVDNGNAIYWEVCGNPEGKPAVMFHGGPGTGCVPSWRRYFDPVAYRIVLFD